MSLTSETLSLDFRLLSCWCVAQSINVSTFHGYRWSGGSMSPVERNYTDAPVADVPVYSCYGAVVIQWNTTGLMEKVEIRVSDRTYVVPSVIVQYDDMVVMTCH